MKRRPVILLTLLLTVLLLACKDKSSTFRLEGEFRNMNQAEFYVLDLASGKRDTVSVVRGRFVYEKAEQDTAMLLLLYPNYSMLPIFAHKGLSLKLKGDASHLKEAELKGSEENDEMTAFRLRAAQMTPPEEHAAAKQFILENPASPISSYLLRHYFIETVDPDYREAYRLCRTMLKATPRNLQLLLLNQQLRVLSAGAVGSRLPAFVLLDKDGKVVTNADLKGKVSVVCLWSSWNYDSRKLVTTVRKLQSKHPDQIALVAISVDAAKTQGQDWLRRDTIGKYVISDGQMWRSPLAVSLGLTTMPSNVVADRNGRIVSRNLVKSADLEKELEKMIAPAK